MAPSVAYKNLEILCLVPDLSLTEQLPIRIREKQQQWSSLVILFLWLIVG